MYLLSVLLPFPFCFLFFAVTHSDDSPFWRSFTGLFYSFFTLLPFSFFYSLLVFSMFKHNESTLSEILQKLKNDIDHTYAPG
mmetsp:Transcript_49662/g.56972  ORF Transcript_49662/g.56972 Transcript_49662/m.56972 type:complete len:82 (-) Transcript_49662:3-248(-)